MGNGRGVEPKLIQYTLVIRPAGHFSKGDAYLLIGLLFLNEHAQVINFR
jgi:hypothetical protein